ncbi:MAG: hypothetical protein GKS06_10060 [Acidobacteria bacterium]|nr:hypothetical protein [Acidobacteriota bacterium]
MNAADPVRFGALKQRALLVGLAALALSLVGWFLDPQQFYQSWLVGFLYWIAFPLGAFGFVCLHNMTGGAWGFVIRRILESAAGTTPLMALLFLPVVLGLHDLYEWADEAHVAADALLQHKAPFLNVPFFLTRAAIYFAIWILFTQLIVRWSGQQDEGNEPRPNLTRRIQLLSGAGLPIYAMTVSFATIDWGMTLEPHWFSTIYGMLFVVGQGLTTLAFSIILLSKLSEREPLAGVVKTGHFHDLGNLSLAFVMLWAYMSFSQYLIIWSGNLPEEISWYLNRSAGGWEFFAPVLIAFHFALSFLLLLARRRKQAPSALMRIAVWILVLRFVDIFWLIAPAFSPGEFQLHWMDITAPLAIGGLWLAFFFHRLGSWPLLPANDPRIDEALKAHEVHA